VAESEKLVKSHHPIASLERLKELGMEPAKYGSCSHRTNGNIGCTFYDSGCPFDRKQFGAFKGTRPHNIGYYIKPLSGPAKTDWIDCFGFCAGLYYRMRYGLSEAAEGRKGEVIRIIGKEGDEIPMRIVKSADPNCNKSLNVRLKVENVKVKIPVFRDPLEADPGLAYEMEIEKKFPMDMEALVAGGVADPVEVASLLREMSGTDVPVMDEPELPTKAGGKKVG
jgi:hypothetical protein